MRMTTGRFRLLAALLFTATCQASADDLMTTYQLAIEQDPEYLAAVNIYEAEQAALGKARAGLLPFLGADAGTKRRKQESRSVDDVPGFDGEAEYDVDDWAVNFSQTLFDVPAWQLYKQAQNNTERAAFNFRAAQQDLIYRVASVYGNVLVAQENLRVSQAEQDALREQYDLDRERLNVGLGTVTDLYATESRYQLAESNVIEADFALRDAIQALKELTGEVPGELRVIAADKPPLTPPAPDSVDHWVEKSLLNNLEFLAAMSSVEIARREVSRLKGQHLPTLDVVASRANTDSDGSISGAARETDVTDIGLRLDIPLIQGWGVVAGTREARARYQAELQQQEGTRRRVDRTARTAYQAVKSGISRLMALAAAVKSGESTLEARREGYKAGVNTNFEVLEAVRDLYGYQRDYINAKYQFILSDLRLRQVAGELQVADLERVNSWLE